MGIDPSQPKGEGPEQSPASSNDQRPAEGVAGISDSDLSALFDGDFEPIDPIYRALGIDPDGIVAEHLEAEVMDSLGKRMPESMLRRAMPRVLGETEDGRVVVALEFRRPEGSLIPAAHLVEGPDPAEPGGFRGRGSDLPNKKVVTTIAGNGALNEGDWERVSGQVTVILTQRYPGQSSDGFTMQLTVNSMSGVAALFSSIELKERNGQPSAARTLLDRFIAGRIGAETGDRESPPDYILITPLTQSEDGVAKLSVVVAATLRGDDYHSALEGMEIEVGLSTAKLLTIKGGTWYNRGSAALYVQELERRERQHRKDAE
jgi:hypothetical protein